MTVTDPDVATDAAAVTDDPAAPVVTVRELRKTFQRRDGSHVRAVAGVDLEVAAAEFVVLLGPSGCGKTSLLRCIAGLERGESGRIDIHGRTMFDPGQRIDLPPQRRGLSMIFQSYALWPHMTAFANVAYPLRSRKVPKSEVAERVRNVLALVGIEELAGQHPANMSGGQQQRVALARALVAGDDLVLFDEPLSNVDAKVREQLRVELQLMQRRIGFSALYVTHDQVEAMELAHRVVVLRDGRIEQQGPGREVYERPVSRYVANFIGTANEIPGTVKELRNATAVVETPLGDVVAGSVHGPLASGSEVALVVRPERCSMRRAVDAPAGEGWPGRLETTLFGGKHTQHIVVLDRDIRVQVSTSEVTDLRSGDPVVVSVASSDVRAVPMDDGVDDDDGDEPPPPSAIRRRPWFRGGS